MYGLQVGVASDASARSAEGYGEILAAPIPAVTTDRNRRRGHAQDRKVIRVLRLVTAWQVSSDSRFGLRREEGQTMAEYGVVLAVIVLTVVVAITALSTSVRGAISSVANILPGS
jgi:Flp pilus assembly pilin Flp